MNKDEANHQDKGRKPAPHISMELKADSARVTNLQMEGSRLILTIEAELSESQVKAADPRPEQPPPASTTVTMPTIMYESSETEETPISESGGTSSAIEDELDSPQSAEPAVFSLPDAVAAGVNDARELASEAFEERVLEEVFSVGADKDTVETINPLSYSGSAVAPSSYGVRPPEPDTEQQAADPLHAFAEAPIESGKKKSPLEETTVVERPAGLSDSISYERLEDEIRKVKGRETSVQYKRPYSEEIAAREKATDESSVFLGKQADDTVPLPPPLAVISAAEVDEEEDTLAAIKPDAYSEVLAAEQSEKERVERDHYNTETGPLPFYAAHMQPAGEDNQGERSEDLDTATQQISYQTMSEQDKDATYNQNSLEDEEEHLHLEAEDRSTEHLLYDQEENISTAIEDQPAPVDAGQEHSDSSAFEFDENLAEQPSENIGTLQFADTPDESADTILTVAPEDLDDDILVLSEESSAFGGERHGEPLPSINFGFDPVPAPAAQEAPPVEEPVAEPLQEEDATAKENEDAPVAAQEESSIPPEPSEPAAPEVEPLSQETPEAEEQEQPSTGSDTQAKSPVADSATPPCAQPQQEGENDGPTLNTGEPPRTPTGGTTVLIRYTCPKCKTQGMQAVDKVGTVVNCTNCGKAMRLVMKK